MFCHQEVGNSFSASIAYESGRFFPIQAKVFPTDLSSKSRNYPPAYLREKSVGSFLLMTWKIRLMKNNHRLVVLAAALLPSLAMAESVDLNVIGTIIPTSCIPAFAGGGTVDLRKISAATLNPTTQTLLPERDISLHINCDAPARSKCRFAITVQRPNCRVSAMAPVKPIRCCSSGLAQSMARGLADSLYVMARRRPTEQGAHC